MRKMSPEEWSEYWDLGTVTTFGGGFADNYDAEFLDFWTKQLDGDLDHVVDLCCGNGALVWIANDLAKKKKAKTLITGVDVADINPFKLLKKDRKKYPKVKFIGKTPIEKLPFDDNSVDVVISQYGIEYSDLNRTVPELSRVLKPSSKMGFIVHSKDSDVLVDSRFRVEKYSYLLGEGQFHEIMFALDELFMTKNSIKEVEADPSFTPLFRALNRARRTVNQMHQGINDAAARNTINNYMAKLTRLLDKSSLKNGKRKQAIIDAKEMVEATIFRSGDLESAALSEDDYQDFIALIENEGFSITESGRINYGGNHNYGYLLVAER